MPVPLYPLRFAPLFKTNLWGGTRLRPWLGFPTSDEPTGEAWIISDVDGSPSRVADGPLTGKTLRELMAEYGEDFLGQAKPIDGRFPLLLKFIDAKQELSVQVHPSDEQAREKKSTAAGKTEAWVILDANPQTSRIYSGFRTGVTAADFRKALDDKTTPKTLHQFTPRPGDCVFLPANTVHAIGADILLFEVQQTSDITYRLYDWDRVDAKTGLPRDLHIEDGLASSDFSSGPCGAVVPKRDGDHERLVACDYFTLDRFTLRRPTPIGSANQCTLVVTIAGTGTLNGEPLAVGDTVLLPAIIGEASIIPNGELTLLVVSTGGASC